MFCSSILKTRYFVLRTFCGRPLIRQFNYPNSKSLLDNISQMTIHVYFLQILLFDGFGGGTTFISIGQVEGASSRENLQTGKIIGFGDRFDEDWRQSEGAKRMNDQCGHYSLLRVV
ncbi:unnamed protein product [Orchesella dallaii]|uniref:Uncharacterized protein n=1 Tax=Orchesella dallaii TaxID=48710 RepID=A0ABP1Q7B8_9HEXA